MVIVGSLDLNNGFQQGGPLLKLVYLFIYYYIKHIQWPKIIKF